MLLGSIVLLWDAFPLMFRSLFLSSVTPWDKSFSTAARKHMGGVPSPPLKRAG
jgi:hypothetical protein